MKVKVFDTDDVNVQTLLTMLRSLDVFKLFDAHSLCSLSNTNTRQNLCNFCLLRSLILKSSQQKGRTKMKPLEFEAAFDDLDSETLTEDIEFIIDDLNLIEPSFKEHFFVTWTC